MMAATPWPRAAAGSPASRPSRLWEDVGAYLSGKQPGESQREHFPRLFSIQTPVFSGGMGHEGEMLKTQPWSGPGVTSREFLCPL